MNLKSKLFGIGAAAVLSLSMATGVMAADPSSDVQVTLGKGDCRLELSWGTDIDFGTLAYDGEGGYSSAHSADIHGTVYNAEPDGLCQVNVMSAGLQKDGTGPVIPLVLDPLTLLNAPPYEMTSEYVGAKIDAGEWKGTISLGEIPNKAPLGNYTGTVNFEVPSGQ